MWNYSTVILQFSLGIIVVHSTNYEISAKLHQSISCCILLGGVCVCLFVCVFNSLISFILLYWKMDKQLPHS